MTKNVTLKNLRPRLPKIINEVDRKMDRFIITRRGKPVALLMSVEDYESVLETLDILGDAKLVKRIKKAREDVKNGRSTPLKLIEKELGLV